MRRLLKGKNQKRMRNRRDDKQNQSGALPAGECKIKGNISSNGDKIYHMPGQQFYNVTEIDTSKGERYFCTKGEAEQAGFRPSKR